ncbi:DNA-binding protein [Ophiobolus disseminans]|uniref:DNA-binding protein n=1 Tax=Ophiobolus disseminans TaxID=1469910 RepID=A0A6A6ZJG5_9PLEO|nr:DNA-binding protein [Ophiobolus disseminans]
MSPPSIDVLEHFKNFLFAYVSTVLYLRSIYPPEMFVEATFHNTSVYQCRSLVLCEYIIDAVEEVYTSLLRGKVKRIGILIYTTEGMQAVERHVFDVSAFRIIESNMRKGMQCEERDPLSPISLVSAGAEVSFASEPSILQTTKQGRLDEDTPPDLSEQFRAALIMLVNRCKSYTPSATSYSFHIYMELKSDENAHLLTQGSERWVSAHSHGTEAEENSTDDGTDSHKKERVSKVIRAVNYPPISFEVWVETF